jgi:hypothetical protein
MYNIYNIAFFPDEEHLTMNNESIENLDVHICNVICVRKPHF